MGAGGGLLAPLVCPGSRPRPFLARCRNPHSGGRPASSRRPVRPLQLTPRGALEVVGSLGFGGSLGVGCSLGLGCPEGLGCSEGFPGCPRGVIGALRDSKVTEGPWVAPGGPEICPGGSGGRLSPRGSASQAVIRLGVVQRTTILKGSQRPVADPGSIQECVWGGGGHRKLSRGCERRVRVRFKEI